MRVIQNIGRSFICSQAAFSTFGFCRCCFACHGNLSIFAKISAIFARAAKIKNNVRKIAYHLISFFNLFASGVKHLHFFWLWDIIKVCLIKLFTENIAQKPLRALLGKIISPARLQIRLPRARLCMPIFFAEVAAQAKLQPPKFLQGQ